MTSPACRQWTALLAALLFASLAGGCPARAPKPDDRVRGALESFLATCGREDRAAGLPLLTSLAHGPFLAADTPHDACNQVLGFDSQVLDPASFYRETEVREVHVRGDVADATVRSGTAARPPWSWSMRAESGS